MNKLQPIWQMVLEQADCLGLFYVHPVGATNTVTGISTAYADSVPVLIFTGQVPTPFLGSDAFQEADHIGITRTCTKHNTLVRKTIDLPKAIAEALYISNTGRKGPVLVDMPKDVLIGESVFNFQKM